MATNSYYKTEQVDGITYYFQNESTVVDIDVQPGVQTVTLDDFQRSQAKPFSYRLRGIWKQFPEVTSIQVKPMVACIELSNFLFPNVRSVKTPPSSNFSRSKTYLMRGVTLLNTFCLREDEVLDLAGVYCLANYALEGCRARQVQHAGELYSAYPYAFHGFFGGEPFHHGVRMLGKALYDIEPGTDIQVPPEVKLVNEECDFTKASSLTFSDIHQLGTICNASTHRGQPLERLESIHLDKEVLSARPSHKEMAYFVAYAGKSRVVLPENPYYTEEDGAVYSKDKTVLVAVPKSVTEFTVPPFVKIIGESAFYRCNKLAKVQIPDNVKEIHKYAFGECENLASVQFSEVTPVWLQEEAFYYLPALQSIRIPGCIQSVSHAFKECHGLISLICEEGVQAISGLNLPSLQRMSLPASLKSLDSCTFSFVEQVQLHGDSVADGFFRSFCRYPKNYANYTWNQLLVQIVTQDQMTYYLPRFLPGAAVSSLQGAAFDFGMQAALQATAGFSDAYKYQDGLESQSLISKDLLQDMALQVYKKTGNQHALAYIRGCSRSIYNRFVKDEAEEDKWVSFVRLGVLSATMMEHVLEYAQAHELQVLAAYTLEWIRKRKEKKTPGKPSRKGNSFTL